MPWFFLDDGFHSHPKVMTAGNEAIGLFARCGTYAAQHLTDGFIPDEVALLYGSRELAEVLVKAKLWRRTRGGWRMPDYLDYNPSREDVMEKRRKKAEAGRLGGLASGKTRSKHEAAASRLVEPPSHPIPITAGVTTDGARASPRPVENPETHSSKLNGAATRHPPPLADVLARQDALASANAAPARGRHAKENP